MHARLGRNDDPTDAGGEPVANIAAQDKFPRRGRSALEVLIAAAAGAMPPTYIKRHPLSTTIPGFPPLSVRDVIARAFPGEAMENNHANTGNDRGSHEDSSSPATGVLGADSNTPFDSATRRGGVAPSDIAGGSANKGGRSHSSDGGGGDSSESDQPSPPPAKVHDRPCLSVGEVLMDSLRSPDGESLVYSHPDDGSLVFARVVGASPDREASPPLVTTILIPANARSFAKINEVRFDIYLEERERDEKQDSAGKGKKTKKGKLEAIMRWQPFGKAGWRRARARDLARERIGETSIRITDRGVLVSHLLCFF